jgi:ABC-2 type transport system ATP-binding protein
LKQAGKPAPQLGVVDVRNLSHAYGDRKALDGVSFSVERGEVFGFLGPNGSGKTTLFRLLCTLIPPPVGTVSILGNDPAVERDAVRREIGVVFQSPAVDKQLTAEENLLHHGHLYGLRGANLKTRAGEALAAFGLADRAKERVERFSGGMRRRVELAKGLLHRPRVLLLDEPSTGLDPSARIELWRQVRQIADGGVTVLVTTHLMEEADLCSRLAILRLGKLLACDTPANLKARIGGDVITLSSTNPQAVREAIVQKLGVEPEVLGTSVRLERPRGHEFVPQLIEAAPGLVDSVSVGKPTLQDVFIRLTGQVISEETNDRPEHAAG